MLEKRASPVTTALVLLQAQEIKREIKSRAVPEAWDASPRITLLEGNSVRVIKEQNQLEKMDPNLTPSAPTLATQHVKNPVVLTTDAFRCFQQDFGRSQHIL